MRVRPSLVLCPPTLQNFLDLPWVAFLKLTGAMDSSSSAVNHISTAITPASVPLPILPPCTLLRLLTLSTIQDINNILHT